MLRPRQGAPWTQHPAEQTLEAEASTGLARAAKARRSAFLFLATALGASTALLAIPTLPFWILLACGAGIIVDSAYALALRGQAKRAQAELRQVRAMGEAASMGVAR